MNWGSDVSVHDQYLFQSGDRAGVDSERERRSFSLFSGAGMPYNGTDPNSIKAFEATFFTATPSLSVYVLNSCLATTSICI